MNTLIQEITQRFASDNPFAVATIVSSSGSTPRTAGSKMIVYANGNISGTIGGGLIEARVIQSAVFLIQEGRAVLETFQLNSSTADTMDMICGGELTVFIETFYPGHPAGTLFSAAVQEIRAGEKCLLVSELSGPDGNLGVRKIFVKQNGESHGSWTLPETLDSGFLTSWFRHKAPFITEFGNRRLIVEPLCAGAKVFIFGAGHVSRQLAKITGMIDFQTTIIDDREEFANRERFPSAHDIRVSPDCFTRFTDLAIDGESYIVIVTRGHRHDQTVLEQALKTDACYIGMIGSRGKRDAIYQNLYDKGVDQKAMERVHSPVGLDIAAETPEEIAVSIAAELIRVRNRKTP
ncbi:MAG: XdhC/CoxI family protein [Desulfobacteraceae bacterium]